jgi:ABC-type polysaccharide/polyol phosphate export permease
MTTQPGIGAAQDDAGPSAPIAALITGAPVPRPTLWKTFAAMMAREFRVLGRNATTTIVRSVMQPLLFAFVFAYVLPKTGSGFSAGSSSAPGAATGGLNFATILVPGLMGSMFVTQGMFGITMPLVMEFSWQRTIVDRALAPVPISVLGIQKMTAGAIQACLGAAAVFPAVYWVHAPGQEPHIDVTNWFLLIVVMVFSSTMIAAIGLLLGTVSDPRQMQMIFAVIQLPLTLLGGVYYSWSALHAIPWLQIVVLFNPMIYMTEGLRATLTPGLGHMPVWAILVALIGGTFVFGALAVRTFHNRVLN